ncbi:hypothetical protein jhhlp_000600 [Lomentospora prolificans]|uniref:glucan endo-1,3-beta-D-glucosidase n=1 Tax=Lomentospora prolificans TaxID=41688 RepID=A0A2N3NIX7_9PEZI|nr:hypothetical protein jhhlp_000600 [Lomentospora prolificans]
MQRRHYYDQTHHPESIPLDDPYANNRGPSPVYYPDQSPNPASQGYHDQPYERSSPSRGNTNAPDPYYNQNTSSSRGPHNRGDYTDQRQWTSPPQPSSSQNTHAQSNVTPGADNFSNVAAGGVAGIAYSVADSNARESGVEAMRGQNQPPYGGSSNNYHNGGNGNTNFSHPHQQAYSQPGPYDAANNNGNPNPFAGGSQDGSSRSSMSGYGSAHPQAPPAAYETYANDPYSYSRPNVGGLGVVDPNSIADDGDDGLDYRRPARTSMLSLHSNRSGGRNAAAVAATAAGTGAIGGAVGSGMAADAYGARDSNRNLGMLHDGGSGAAALGGGSSRAANILAEKESPWLKKQHSGKKRWRWVIIIAVFLIIAGAILGGVLGTVLKKDNKPARHGQSADDDIAENGDLSINSAEIKALMNNKDLHKVFPGMDYTPLNTQYPECIHDPPSQNNVTRDVAVLSQLTNVVRLYGTDCNQTQMVVHAIQRLKLEDTMKVWIGVWQDNNSTTNKRQLDQMWDILDEYGEEPFLGLIVANEILFREQMTNSQLTQLLKEVKANVTERGFSLPVATSDLGDKLASPVTDVSDYIMANIHPFFSGVNVDEAASWTTTFWENNNKPVWKSDKSKNIIAEIGWPSQGGTNCGDGTATGCPKASVAGVDELNTLLQDWVCDALNNGTEYFWFSAFDEPWKVRFNEDNKNWEDHWGMFDVNRNLKDGLTIPDCGGKTV